MREPRSALQCDCPPEGRRLDTDGLCFNCAGVIPPAFTFEDCRFVPGLPLFEWEFRSYLDVPVGVLARDLR